MPAGPSYDHLIRATRLVTGGRETSGCVAVRDGRIAWVGPGDPPGRAERTTELGPDEVLLPGLVDSHVHVCDPGHPDWEDFTTATRAAAAGGITTIVDMPLDNVPVTTTVAALGTKRQAATGRCHVDVGFWGGVVPDNLGALAPLHRAGVLGFKCFLSDPGSAGFAPIAVADLAVALAQLGPLGVPLLVHAELDGPDPGPVRHVRDHLASRPVELEAAAVAAVIDAARVTGARAHVVHVSSAAALVLLAQARATGVAVSAETCPHYLTFAAEELADDAVEAKCLPPVRAAADRDALWEALRRGVVDLVVSDHSPCSPAMKAGGDYGRAWGGVSSLQLGLPVVWTAARARGVTLAQVAGWMAERPAALAGLADRGRIAVGLAADLCVLAPDETFVVDPDRLHHRRAATPYDGRRLYGVVRRTMLRGRWLTGDGPPQGRLLRREGAVAA